VEANVITRVFGTIVALGSGAIANASIVHDNCAFVVQND